MIDDEHGNQDVGDGSMFPVEDSKMFNAIETAILVTLTVAATVLFILAWASQS